MINLVFSKKRMIEFALSRELSYSSAMLMKFQFLLSNHYLPVNWLWGKAVQGDKNEKIFLKHKNKKWLENK